jgi:abhydrolase domain-containing protein 12
MFDKLLEPLLPPTPPSFKSLSPSISEVEFEAIRSQHEEYKRLRDDLVRTSRVKEDYIIRHEFLRGDRGAPTVYLETSWGGHERMPVQEGVQDIIREVFNLCECLS